MVDDVQFIGQELAELDPDVPKHLQPRRYRVTALCLRCQEEYEWVTTKLEGKDRPCPKKRCREAARAEEIEREVANRTKMLEEQRPPGHIGDKPIVKAIDTTAQIVMEDHGLTDLKDNIRRGESMAPKLPPAQQRMADGFFGGQNLIPDGAVNRRRQAQMDRLARSAIAGAFRGTAPPANLVLPGRQGEPALRSLGADPSNPAGKVIR